MYEKSECQTGIVHIGYGNFHRAHQAMYIDEYMRKTGDLRWGIVAVNLRNEGFREIDDYIVKTPTRYKKVRSHLDYIDWTKNRTVAKHMLTLPSVHLITITVTESGYAPGSPLFEYLACGLRNRTNPITILCCDNIRQNGVVLETQFLAYLYQTNQYDLADWVKANVKFPSCMVDRITPRTTDTLRHEIEEKFPGFGATAVQTEEYTQWVIEDDFCAGRPHLENVGVTFTSDVHSYEVMKIRILNAGHQFVANAGELLSIKTISGCMSNTLIKKLFYKVHIEEVIPHVSSVPNVSPRQYVDFIAERFSNPAMVNTVRRVSFDGSARHPGFVLPIVRQCLSKNMSIQGLALIEAIWARMCYGTREDGSLIESNDPNWDNLKSVAKEAKTNPKRWIEQRIYDND